MHRRRAAVWWNESHSTARWRKIKGDSSALSAGPVLAGSFCILVCVWYGVVLRLHLFVSLLAFSVAASRAMEQPPPPVCFDLSLGTILFAPKRRVDFTSVHCYSLFLFISYPTQTSYVSLPTHEHTQAGRDHQLRHWLGGPEVTLDWNYGTIFVQSSWSRLCCICLFKFVIITLYYVTLHMGNYNTADTMMKHRWSAT